MNQATSATVMRPKRRWGRWVLVALALLVGGVVLLHWNWRVGAQARLDARVAELRARGEPVLMTELAGAPVPDERNAAVELKAALKRLEPPTPAWKAFQGMEGPERLPWSEEEREAAEAALAEHVETLRLLRTARAKPEIDWGTDFSKSPIDIMLPHLKGVRELANLAAARAMAAHVAGDDAAAVESLRDLVFLSRVTGKQPILVSHLVAIGISVLAADRIEQIAPSLRVGAGGKAASREQVKALIDELLDEKALRESHRGAFQGERAFGYAMAMAVRRGELSADQLAGQMLISQGTGERLLGKSLAYGLAPMVLSDAELMLRHTTTYVDHAMDPDWPTFDAAVQDLPAELKGSNPMLHPLARMLLPALKAAGERHFFILTERRMAAASLGVRLYALEHDGKLPATLAELSPAYLPAVPLDPMAAGNRPIGYDPEAKNPILYSVGRDGKDQKGSEALVGTRSPTAGRWQREDAVVHLKLQPKPAPATRPAEP